MKQNKIKIISPEQPQRLFNRSAGVLVGRKIDLRRDEYVGTGNIRTLNRRSDRLLVAVSRGGIPTGITQNVKDLLTSPEIQNIFDNTDFFLMLNQANADREILGEKLGLSREEMRYLTNAEQGCGLMVCGNVVLPFENRIPTDTQLYRMMTTKPNEKF